MSASFADAENAFLQPRYSATAVTVSLSTTTATSALLPAGHYLMKSTAQTFIKQGGSAVTAVIATSYPIDALKEYPLTVEDATDGYVAGILAAGTGTLYLLRVGG